MTVVEAALPPYDPRVAVCSADPDHDRMDVFVRGSDNACWYRSFDGSGWSQWVSLGGTLTSDPAAMASGGVPWVFARWSDNSIRFKWIRGPGQPGSEWQPLHD